MKVYILCMYVSFYVLRNIHTYIHTYIAEWGKKDITGRRETFLYK